MSDTPIANADQAEYWSSPSGAKWVDFEGKLDAALAPALDQVLAVAGLSPGHTVLDIGCGTGISSLTAAQAVTPGGHVTGADISSVMLARAHTRAAGAKNLTFVETDVQSHDFRDAGFDRVISRFGVMFFENPVAAFANIARAMTPGGTLSFIAWSGMAANPWFRVPFEVASDLLGAPEPGDPRAPGPMAFQDIDYVTGILSDAGLTGIDGRECAVDLTPLGGAAAVAEFACQVGPAARILGLRDGTAEDARQIEAVVRARLENYDTPGGLRVPATLNLFTALKS